MNPAYINESEAEASGYGLLDYIRGGIDLYRVAQGDPVPPPVVPRIAPAAPATWYQRPLVWAAGAALLVGAVFLLRRR